MQIAEYIQEAIDAAIECEKAREGYEGGSWGYHGHMFITRKHDAADKLESALEQLVIDTVMEMRESGRI